MLVVNAVIKTNEENISAMKDALAAMEDASRAEKGCYDYTFSVELNDPTTLRITERWENMEALQAHFQSPHMSTFQAAMAKYQPDDVQAYFYDAKEVSPPA